MAAASSCRLYLITPPLGGRRPRRFRAALRRGARRRATWRARCVRVAPAAEGDAKRIAPAPRRTRGGARRRDARRKRRRGWPRASARTARISTGVGAELAEALASLHPARIVGAGGLRSRDDAMAAGEAGADYVMFGEPRRDGFTPPLAETVERTAWWAEIFETPCVAFAGALDAVAPLTAAGADFVALGDAIWLAPSAAAADGPGAGACGESDGVERPMKKAIARRLRRHSRSGRAGRAARADLCAALRAASPGRRPDARARAGARSRLRRLSARLLHDRVQGGDEARRGEPEGRRRQ